MIRNGQNGKGGSMKKRKILIAEDDKISFEYLKEILKNVKAEILLAKNGSDAIDMCNRHSDIELVFMDIKMPEKDGVEATHSIKKIRPDLPVIAQTAYALNDERETILHEGFDDYIAKPIQRDDVLSIIEKYMK